MPLIPADILDCVVNVFPAEYEAEEGVGCCGNGFIVSLLSEDAIEKDQIVFITNRHVVDNGGSILRLYGEPGRFKSISIEDCYRSDHPAGADIAAFVLGRRENFPQLATISERRILPSDHASLGSFGVGSDVFMVGRYIDNDGRQRASATVRFGHLAQMDTESVKCDGYEYKSYLIESFSVAGYSGSPVFTWFGPLPAWSGFSGTNSAPIGNGPFLIGIQWGQMRQKAHIFDESGRKYGSHFLRDVGLSCVAPFHQITQVLNTLPR